MALITYCFPSRTETTELRFLVFGQWTVVYAEDGSQETNLYGVGLFWITQTFILSSSFTSLHHSFLHGRRLRRTSEFAGCIPGYHTAEQLQQLLLQVKAGGRRIYFLYFKMVLTKILFCELLYPEIYQVCSDSSCKTTLGITECSFVHWAGSSNKDVVPSLEKTAAYWSLFYLAKWCFIGVK